MSETSHSGAKVHSLTNSRRNPGMPLRQDWFENAKVNLSAAERRAATLTTRRTVKKNYQAAWLPPFPLAKRYERDRESKGRSEE